MSRVVSSLTCALAILAIATASNAVVIEPDGTMVPPGGDEDYWTYVALDSVDWHGDVLASRTTPFEIREYSEEAGRDVWARGTVLHEVIRETRSGYLSFHYRIDVNQTSGDVTDFEGATAYDFGHYFTDVRGSVEPYDLPFLRRGDSSFGNFIHYANFERLDNWFVVRTDAPAFAEGGTLKLHYDFDGWGEDGGADVATFQPVPEPGAGATVLLTGVAALCRRRRRLRSVPPPAAGR